MKFKVGQVVEVIDKKGIGASLGATAVVTRGVHKWHGLELIDVEWKTNYNNQMNGGYRLGHFKPMLAKGQQLLFEFTY